MPDGSSSIPSTIADLLDAMSSGKMSVRRAIEPFIRRIKAREGEVGAWIALDWNAVDQQIRKIESVPLEQRGPLWGVPLGVKDLYDTVDFPAAYGTEFYAGHRPPWDAACVARLRAAGAIILGKTVSTELAYWKAGKTRNPLDLGRTPGGSSSGSAAAVADGMAPAALATQTAASTIRPAAYCGVVGFKPTHGLISLAGVKTFAMSLDTAGLIARSVTDASLVSSMMAARPDWVVRAQPHQKLKLVAARAPEWDRVTPSAMDVFEKALNTLADAGLVVSSRLAPKRFTGLADAQNTIMACEAARDYAFERDRYGEMLSAPLRNLIEQGDTTNAETYSAALRERQMAVLELDRLFEDADLLAAPSANGEAPFFEEGTGDPAMCRAWTLLGLPCITVPCGIGLSGLPLGLQLAARPHHDRQILEAAAWIEACL